MITVMLATTAMPTGYDYYYASDYGNARTRLTIILIRRFDDDDDDGV
jgi:hypothetical protein